MLTPASAYKESFVPIAEFEKVLLDCLAFVKERAQPTKLIVLSCAPTQHQIASSRVAANKTYFGEPETMARYNETIARVTRQAGGQYVDIYDPMARSPQPATLFMYDGIHLNNAGNRFVALELLRTLGSKGKQP